MLKLSTNVLNYSFNNGVSTKSSVVSSSNPNSNTQLSSSPKLVNYIEQTAINDYAYTSFYTEVDSGFQVGDRVFIINGNYDSSNLITKSLTSKYQIGSDGYQIIAIDRCKITLNLEYTSNIQSLTGSVWNTDDFDNFIKVYYIRNQREFNYANQQFISRTNSSGSPVNKFSLQQNNFIYVDGPYNGITQSVFGKNSGVNSAGFYYLNGTYSWTKLNNFKNLDLSSNGYLSTDFSNNGRIIIMNGTFTDTNGNEWRESNIYSFITEPLSEYSSSFYENYPIWAIDYTYMQPFITKSNFRGGNFTGTWGKGIFGSYDQRVTWGGTNSNFNNGTLLNTQWLSGTINSLYSTSASYYTQVNPDGSVTQKSNTINNGGYGYTYVIDSDIKSSTTINGNYVNSNFTISPFTLDQYYSTQSIVESFYNNTLSMVNSQINGGYFQSCNFESVSINNGVISSSRIVNSYVNSSKSINSNINASVFNKSNYESDNLIKILGYDEWKSYLNNDPNQYKIYKFYISDADLHRMKSLDKFYISGLKVNASDYFTEEYENVLSFFDRGFILDSYTEYDDIISQKLGKNITCKLTSAAENNYIITESSLPSQTATLSTINPNNMASIDIILEIDISTLTDFKGVDYGQSNIDISKAYIVDSYYDGGLFNDSTWNSGAYFNYNNDYVIQFIPNILNPGVNSIQVLTPTSKGVNDNYLKLNDIVYLNGVDYNDGITGVYNLPNIYRITNINGGILTLTEFSTNILPNIPFNSGGRFLLTPSPDGLTSSLNRSYNYNYIHKLMIENSNINNGIFRRTYINNSNITSSIFNNSDYLFQNIPTLKSLMLMDIIFSDNSNIINNGLYVNSYFKEGSDYFNNGIIWQSLWQSGTFSNGVFRESNWINGTFNNGIFYLNNNQNLQSYYTYLNNNSNVWQNGTFNNGNVYNSIWLNGNFINGNIYKSTWYNGTFLNGNFGSDKFNISDNNFYGGTFSNGVVVNSYFYATGSNINWLNGTFQSGHFGNNPNYESTWTTGIFNGGNFADTAVWLNGTFNNGNFISYYGSNLTISPNQSDYPWQYGIFNNGKFGTADGLTNSNWWDGEFNGGTFQGKVWNNGVFAAGSFEGSGTMSSSGGGDSTYVLSGTSSKNATIFVDSFSSSYYGLWLNGYVTNIKDQYITNRELFTQPIRKSQQPSFISSFNLVQATFENMLWINGTFSHKNGQMNNVVWIGGNFNLGKFNNGSFNPYVAYNSLTASFNSNAVWNNGTFNGGDFYYSNWNDGTFISGTGVGMIWNNGTSYYMNAYNIFWNNGDWKNGNWYGSPFQFSGSITDSYIDQIISNGMVWSGTTSCHIWNIFDNPLPSTTPIISSTASNPVPITVSWQNVIYGATSGSYMGAKYGEFMGISSPF